MNVWRRLIGFALNYQGRLSIAIVAMVLYGLGSLALPALIGPVLDTLSGKPGVVVRFSPAMLGGLIIAA